jgi:hypothetical protein
MFTINDNDFKWQRELASLPNLPPAHAAAV